MLHAPPKEMNTHPIPDDYYVKPICPSGGHPCGRERRREGIGPRATKPGRGSKRTVIRR